MGCLTVFFLRGWSEIITGGGYGAASDENGRCLTVLFSRGCSRIITGCGYGAASDDGENGGGIARKSKM